jgi:hypothetical protein
MALQSLGQGQKTRNKKKGELAFAFEVLAEWTGLEPATPGVTGRYSNQLNYHSNDNYCLTASPAPAQIPAGGC